MGLSAFSLVLEQQPADLVAADHPDPDTAVSDYRVRFPDAHWGQIRSAMLGDALFVSGGRRLVQAHSSHAPAPLHQYLFSWRSNACGGTPGWAPSTSHQFTG